VYKILADISNIFPSARTEEIYTNSVFAGVVIGLFNLQPEAVLEIIRRSLAKKDEKVIEKNIQAFKAGLAFIQASENWRGKYQIVPSGETDSFLAIYGNQAIALGAIAADCRFYSVYPMTPLTSIFEILAAWAHKTNMIVEQAEDEIAALNMVLGASYAGTRVMTGTSGGGFALMTEAISLAGITECPAVIVNAQRPGPATGLPTRTEQSDLEFVIHAGHGEFPKAVLAPGNYPQCFYLTAYAFNLAERYQIPVIILTDQYLADLYGNVKITEMLTPVMDRGKLDSGNEAYLRFKLTEDGISPRAIPGKSSGVVVVDSDEHTKDGHLTEDLQVRKQMNEKRLRKSQGLREEMLMPEVRGEYKENAVICWGSTYGVCWDAVETLRSQGYKVSLIHFMQVWPLDENKLQALLGEYENLICVENNATGQLARLIRAETSIKVNHNVLKYNGEPFFSMSWWQRLSAV